MTTTTTGKAASNGSQPEKLSGMARVQEADAWRTASVAHDAASEAERLCNDIYNAVSAAYFDTKTATQVAASEEVRAKAAEARLCLYAAANYLTALIDSHGEPPF